MITIEVKKVINIKYQNRRRIWRRQKNLIFVLFSIVTMIISLFLLIWILFTILVKGLNSISWDLFTEITPPPGELHGGLANAIVGSALLIFFSTILSVPIGLMAGIYLSEYGKNYWIAEVIRFVNGILLSAPSIVIGLFVYTIVVIRMHHFSGLAGIIALMLLQIPIIIQTTENMLNLVPDSLREAAYALGVPKWKTILLITLKSSISGIITGILLSVSRIAGETGSLLFTSLSNQFWNINLNEPISTLPLTIFNFAISPFLEWQKLAWSGVLLITLFILSVNILARFLFFNKKI